MKTTSLTAETTDRILDTAWSLIVRTGRSDVSLAEIARLAGVSRQALYLAFGDRTGLLVAMARRADAASAHSRRMQAIASGDGADGAALHAFVDAWLDHLPEIYPVGVLLVAAAVTDPAAASVVRDRMEGSLLDKYAAILVRLARAGGLVGDWQPKDAAAFCWSLTHIDAWKNLVEGQGWTPARFRSVCHAVIDRTLLAG
ncbi:MAG: TetR/AcrR family transcriptional regulator [Alphaproteobacteria bacterium]